MCMQDLAIDARITWRRVENLAEDSNGNAVIPPNPNRVALGVSGSNNYNPQVIRIDTAGGSPGINTTYDQDNGFMFVKSVVTLADFPGLSGATLYTDSAPANLRVWEAVVDTALSTAVQRLNADIGP